MKINLDWLADYVTWTIPNSELFERINRQLGEIERIIDVGQKYEGGLVVEVVQVTPLGDKLNRALIDDGQVAQGVVRQDKGLVEVVCGCPTLKAGMLAAWLPPGSVVPQNGQKIGSKEILGVKSQGMLASSLELELAQTDQLLDLTQTGKVGQSLKEALGLGSGVVEIDNKMFTHRPDCFGLFGLAREIAIIADGDLKIPDWYENPPNLGAPLASDWKLEVLVPELVPGFCAFLIEGLTIKPSPLSLQARLMSVDLPAVNNIVDATNHWMYLTGQPSHAFDADRLRDLSGQQLSLQARLSKQGESLKLLNSKTITFTEKEPSLVIATDQTPVALAGIMGGSASQVGPQTKNILLEVANFDLTAIRQASLGHGLFTQAGVRYTKNINPAQLKLAPHLAQTLATLGAGQVKSQASLDPVVKDQAPIKINPQFITSRLGSYPDKNLDEASLKDLFVQMGCQVQVDGELEVIPPFWRIDLSIAEDLVEEVGRLYGFENLELEIPNRPMRFEAPNKSLVFEETVRALLSQTGANETINYSFVGQKFLQEYNQDPAKSFKILKPISPQREFYRQSLTPSLADKAKANARRQTDFALFEIGASHHLDGAFDDEGLPLDLPKLALVVCQDDPKRAFYSARRYLDLVAREFGWDLAYEVSRTQTLLTAPYDQTWRAEIFCQEKSVGVIGLLANNLAGWELDLAQNLPTKVSHRQSVGKYPASHQDITLQVERQLPYDKIWRTLKAKLDDQIQGWHSQLELVSIFYPAQKDSQNISWRLSVASPDKTLTKSEVSELVAQLVEAANQVHQAVQI